MLSHFTNTKNNQISKKQSNTSTIQVKNFEDDQYFIGFKKSDVMDDDIYVNQMKIIQNECIKKCRSFYKNKYLKYMKQFREIAKSTKSKKEADELLINICKLEGFNDAMKGTKKNKLKRKFNDEYVKDNTNPKKKHKKNSKYNLSATKTKKKNGILNSKTHKALNYEQATNKHQKYVKILSIYAVSQFNIIYEINRHQKCNLIDLKEQIYDKEVGYKSEPYVNGNGTESCGSEGGSDEDDDLIKSNNKQKKFICICGGNVQPIKRNELAEEYQMNATKDNFYCGSNHHNKKVINTMKIYHCQSGPNLHHGNKRDYCWNCVTQLEYE